MLQVEGMNLLISKPPNCSKIQDEYIQILALLRPIPRKGTKSILICPNSYSWAGRGMMKLRSTQTCPQPAGAPSPTV